MRILKKLFFGLLLLVVAFVIIGMLLPREVAVERSIVIEAPASEIYPHVSNLQATTAWSPWLGQDPETKLTFNEVEAGVGAVMEWASDNPNVGRGHMEIVEAVENQSVAVALDFGDMGTADASWTFEEADGQTTATWGMVADMGAGPIGRWMGLKMDDWVGADYERGLQNLKTLVEGG
ncbi:Polyketide cyclase / dehydrase and lipid transport [Roseovarius albus]|uniref:Polyketide cyclase / dehydrase and lipid transport n=1 Tax=Roseovarius albus TaxID=1247867 RepID=A0A1X6YID1_9RHOB|nr:SRPBCC family protein [Roseovarius albus]SLN22058.1 Polyketide cyclase / dehydrase and lipid transport [Roseovarius albus]